MKAEYAGYAGGAYPKKRRIVFAERIFGITYHISSSHYLSEDIHTNYTDITLGYSVLLKGVMTQG